MQNNKKHTLAHMHELASFREGRCLSSRYHGMHVKLEWECCKKHRWSASPDSIKHQNSWCPYCSGRKCVPEKSFGSLHPNLVQELHPEKNENFDVFDTSPGSNKEVWWLCSKSEDHEWKTQIKYRVRGYGCPFCKKAANNLAVKFPDIAREWDSQKNNGLKPEDVMAHARIKVWWICPKNPDHSYDAWVYNRTSQNSGCPYCRGLKVNHTNCLATLFPEIAKQWHPDKNGDLAPSDVSAGSDKKVWWRCERNSNHEWIAIVGDRTRGTGCPHCSPQTSLNEIRIFTELETLFPKARQRFKVHEFEADIFIDELNLAVEYDGNFWHRNKRAIERDRKKNFHLVKKNITLLRVRERPLQKISDFDILVESSPLSKDDLNHILQKIVQIFSLDHAKFKSYQNKLQFQGNQRYNEIISFLPGPAPEQSLAAVNPDIAVEFHPTKNSPLTPWHFFPSGGQKVWWLCSKDNSHEWQTTPNSRTYGNYGCPMCSGMMASPANNLAVMHPELMEEWHPEKNKNYDPRKVKPGSNYKVWWQCKFDKSHEWEAVISSRVNRKQKCPKCHPYFVSEENNFAVKFPEIALEWHPNKNGLLGPKEVSVASTTKVWWLCSKNKDHDWKATVGSRTGLGTGCPICTGRLCERDESIQNIFPELASEWHPDKNGDLCVDRVKPTSSRNVWWVCRTNSKHVWQEVISNRVCGSKCPQCVGL